MNTRVETLLRSSQLSITDSRKKILRMFLSQKGALSHADIESKAAGRFDRVTVYRTLQTFVEKGLIHTIPSNDNSIRYALCRHECSEGHHHDNHVHFMCRRCGSTTCLDEVTVPEVKLPRGYSTNNIEMVVNGVCSECRG